MRRKSVLRTCSKSGTFGLQRSDYTNSSVTNHESFNIEFLFDRYSKQLLEGYFS